MPYLGMSCLLDPRFTNSKSLFEKDAVADGVELKEIAEGRLITEMMKRKKKERENSKSEDLTST